MEVCEEGGAVAEVGEFGGGDGGEAGVVEGTFGGGWWLDVGYVVGWGGLGEWRGGGMWLTLLGRSFSVRLRDFARRRCRCNLVRTYGLLRRGCSRLRRADELPLLGV